MPFAYLDHAAPTPLRPEARAAIVDVLDRFPGNPSGQHRVAREARRRLDDARDQVAEVLGVEPGEVVFTSGGTESDNLAVTGAVAAMGGRPACLATDHHAVLDPVRAAGGLVVGVLPSGIVDLDALAATLAANPDLAVLSLALANNETGVVQPVVEVAALLRAQGRPVTLHLDAVAAAAWTDLATAAAEASLMSVSGHKVGGPKGIGALVVRRGTPLRAHLLGGGQEAERRAGTQNLAGAAGLAAALAASTADRDERVARVGALRDRLEQGLAEAAPGDLLATVPAGVERIATTTHLTARGVHREALLFRLDRDGVAASAGSSCASGAPERSHVVEALGVAPERRDGALRLSLGWSTTVEEIDHALAVVPSAVADLQAAGTRAAVS